MDNLTNFMVHLIGNIFTCTFHTYFWYKISAKKGKMVSKKFLITVIVTALLMTLNSILFSNPIKLISITLILMTSNYVFVSKDIRTSIMSVILSQIIIALSEFSFVVIGPLIFGKDFNNKMGEYLTNPLVYIMLNLYIVLISLMLTKIAAMKTYVRKINKISYLSNINESLLYSIMIIIIMIIASVECYMNISITIIIITNIIITIVYIYIVIRFTEAKLNFNKINAKYQTSISSLKEYENMIDKFRVNTHENKNELMTIRNMVKSNDKKTVEYIDTLVNNKIKDNEKIMYKTAKIPEGGLRATIYSKLCVMDNFKIKYNLDISDDVRAIDLISLEEDTILNICKILGVFLDNAIEAVKKLRKRNIDIEIYVMDQNLCIDITNNFKGNVDVNKINRKNYTTKGKGHGYGLSLVKQIIKENDDKLENELIISGNNFTQTLKIKNRH